MYLRMQTIVSNSSELNLSLYFVYKQLYTKNGNSVRIVLFLIGILFGLSSCVSLNHNYLGAAKRQAGASAFVTSYIAKQDSARLTLDAQMDSLLLTIWRKKKEDKCLSAGEINLLYSNFGSQLDYDRTFNAMLQSNKTRRKFLTPMQRYAGARLLYSAWLYDKSYQQVDVIRRALNRGDKGNQIPRNVMQKARRFLYAPSIRKKLSYRKKISKPDAVDSLLRQLPKATIFKEAYYSIFRQNDRIHSIRYNLFSFAGNRLFGSGGNRYTNRKKQKRYATQLLSVLQPYDILLSKSPGHLSGKVIPGYFGHASIWLGNEIPKKRRFLQGLKNSNSLHYKLHQKGMAEALRNGVQVSNLQEYADGEVFVVLRPRSLSSDQKKRVVDNTMKQMGKRYDFNFDIESPDMVNCTELVFLAYDFIDWEACYFMDRYTLFPDDLMLTAFDNKEQFDIVALLKDGKLIENPAPDMLKELVK